MASCELTVNAFRGHLPRGKIWWASRCESQVLHIHSDHFQLHFNSLLQFKYQFILTWSIWAEETLVNIALITPAETSTSPCVYVSGIGENGAH